MRKTENNIRALSRQKGFTLSHTMEAAGIKSTNYFYKMLNGGPPNMQDVYALCQVLECDVRDIWPDKTEIVVKEIMVPKKVIHVVRGKK